MKNKINYIGALVAVLLLWIAPHQTCHCQTIDTLSFHDNFDYGLTSLVLSATSKPQRVSSTGRGNVEINYMDNNMPDSLKTAMQAAANIWSGYMNTGDVLYVDIYYTSTAMSDITTSVIYSLNVDEDTFYPSSLLRKLENETSSTSSYDAQMVINSSINWCIGFGENNANNPKKLTLAALQSIARGLGYGSTIIKDKRGNLSFNMRNKISIFDKLIFSADGTRLESKVGASTSDLSSFVQPNVGYLYALKNSEHYKLYAPSVFDESKSLCRSCDSTSIMYHGNHIVNNLTIDDVTLELLSAIGWDFRKEAQVKIVGDGIDSTGIASAYVNHTFRLQTNGVTLSNHQWAYILPLKNGGCDTVATSTNSIITIPAIEDETIYERNIEGDICGTIVYNGLNVDEPVSCVYNITLELKPQIIDVVLLELSRTNTNNPYYFDATIGVYYVGSHYLHSYVEEEYSSLANVYYSNASYYAQLHLKDVNSYGGVWLHITSRNDYGSDTYVYEIPHYDYLRARYASIEKENSYIFNRFIDVYNATGLLIKRIDDLSELANMAKQLYILKIHNGDGTIRTIKYHNR